MSENYSFERLTETLIIHEAYRRHPYKDTVGKLTVGIGRNLEDKGISRDEAEYLLENDIAECVRDLDHDLMWWRSLNPVRQEVLINMCFNMGIGRRENPARGLLSFRNTLSYIEHGRYVEAAAGMLQSKWARQVGRRAEELAEMMRTGKPQS